MIRTIKQRIYIVGLLPLALLAVAVVTLNGISRIDDANQTLADAKNVTAALLERPAEDALVVGNLATFEKAAKDVLRSSPWLVCLALRDSGKRVLVQAGNCGQALVGASVYPVTPSADGLSDYGERTTVDARAGELAIVMSDEGIVLKRRQVVAQLAVSLLMIAVVVWLIGRLLRVRLIEPIHQVGVALTALGRRDFAVKAEVLGGDDEVARLANAVNDTIGTVAKYTRELELRRGDADQALHDADEANLIRDGLVRTLSEDLEEPMRQMHSELTSIAMANRNPALRERIRSVIALLQSALGDFADLMEIASSGERGKSDRRAREVAEVASDMERDIRALSEAKGIPVRFVVRQTPLAPGKRVTSAGVYINVDAVRLRKALVYLVRAIMPNSVDASLFVGVEFVEIARELLQISVHIKGLFARSGYTSLNHSHSPPERLAVSPVATLRTLGLSDREAKIVDYLLRVVGTTPVVSMAASGSVSILFEITCKYALESSGRGAFQDWTFATRPISITLVSDDQSLVRLTTRGDISNHDVKLLSFSQALESPASLQREDAILIDISGDMAEVLRLIDDLRSEGKQASNLIAITPHGQMSDKLADKLVELGFRGVLQKPLHYSKLIDVTRMTMEHMLVSRARRDLGQ